MKDQYVGDVNDFAKYCILNRLSVAGFSVGICWMLTSNNSSEDGRHLSYLEEKKYRECCPGVFDFLRGIVLSGKRSVAEIEASGIVPNAKYYRDIANIKLEDHLDLLFLDPDNGFQIKSIKKGRKNSDKYVYWDDARLLFKRGYSIIVYQHFPRVDRIDFMDNLSSEIFSNIGSNNAFHLYTPMVDFVVVPQLKHAKRIKALLDKI